MNLTSEDIHVLIRWGAMVRMREGGKWPQEDGRLLATLVRERRFLAEIDRDVRAELAKR